MINIPATAEHLVGRTISEVRRATKAEALTFGWREQDMWGLPVILVLDDGTRILPGAGKMCDRYGSLCALHPNGNPGCVSDRP